MADVECRVCLRWLPQNGRHLDEHGRMIWCQECFAEWYDGELQGDDRLNPIKVANVVRARHGMGPLS